MTKFNQEAPRLQAIMHANLVTMKQIPKYNNSSLLLPSNSIKRFRLKRMNVLGEQFWKFILGYYAWTDPNSSKSQVTFKELSPNFWESCDFTSYMVYKYCKVSSQILP